jgi:hypothetical protein
MILSSARSGAAGMAIAPLLVLVPGDVSPKLALVAQRRVRRGA